jgi:hypothetical protein
MRLLKGLSREILYGWIQFGSTHNVEVSASRNLISSSACSYTEIVTGFWEGRPVVRMKIVEVTVAPAWARPTAQTWQGYEAWKWIISRGSSDSTSRPLCSTLLLKKDNLTRLYIWLNLVKHWSLTRFQCTWRTLLSCEICMKFAICSLQFAVCTLQFAVCTLQFEGYKESLEIKSMGKH